MGGDLVFGTTPTGSYAVSERMRINRDGKVGIGTVTPSYQLEVHKNGSANFRLVSSGSTPSNPSVDIFDTTHSTEFVLSPSAGKVDLFTYSNHALALGTNNTERLRILSNGSVGIGTSDPGSFKLAVNGKIWTQEVNVQMTNPGPDYVFEKEYDLISLSELETYIKANKHLPEVPSAKEMYADGLNLKEMNLLLLKKVEELTLYLIDLKKENDELKKKTSDIDLLKSEIELIKKSIK